MRKISIEVPEYFDMSLGDGTTYRFLTAKLPVEILTHAALDGMGQRFKAKIVDQWADADKVPVDEATGQKVSRTRMADAMHERLCKGEWNTTRAGGTRTTDPVMQFVRQEAITVIKATIKAGKASIDGKPVDKITPEAIAKLLPKLLGNEKWVEKTKALYVPVVVDDDFNLAA